VTSDARCLALGLLGSLSVPVSLAKISLSCAALLLLAAAGLSSGCTSRTVPLPPPSVQALSAPDEDGIVTVSGLCHERAAVAVINDATLTGVIVTSEENGCDSSCPFEARLAAESGDSLRVWQFFETKRSLDVVVPTR
jgi:hypothetical protein